jgi:hypothetical protein
MLRALRIDQMNTIRPFSDINGLGFTQIKEQRSRSVEESEESPGLAVRDQGKVRHTTPGQWMPFTGAITDVQSRQVRRHLPTNFVQLKHLRNCLSERFRPLVCSL